MAHLADAVLMLKCLRVDDLSPILRLESISRLLDDIRPICIHGRQPLRLLLRLLVAARILGLVDFELLQTGDAILQLGVLFLPVAGIEHLLLLGCVLARNVVALSRIL